MMKWVEISAKTVEEAVTEGMNLLGVKKDNINIEVINEPSQGFLKFLGNKQAKVKISILREPEEYIKHFLLQVMNKIGLDGDVNVSSGEDDIVKLEIVGDNMGVLIGKRGSTLNALQYLANIVFHRQFNLDKKRVLIDIENYRQKRKKSLEMLANNLALKVTKTEKEIELEPMSAQERRIIHLSLKNNKRVTTFSKGEEPNRKVIIAMR
jgi:spoIIIJ-associated protein